MKEDLLINLTMDDHTKADKINLIKHTMKTSDGWPQTRISFKKASLVQ